MVLMKIGLAMMVVVLVLGWGARASEPLALGSMAVLGLEGGGVVVGRVVEVSETHVHLVAGGLNRKMRLAALDAAARARLGVGAVNDEAPVAGMARPDAEGGLETTRDRLRSALERYEAEQWRLRPVGMWHYCDSYAVPVHWGWPLVLPLVLSAPGWHWGGSSSHIWVNF